MIFELIQQEQERQDHNIELIASENFVSDSVLKALGSCLTNKYSEGYPSNRYSGREGRYYGGCQYIDQLEEYCCNTWRKAFNTDYHVNVQPHSGTQANLAAYAAICAPGDTILSLSLDNGGHLSHGSSVNMSGKLYNFHHYTTDEQGFIDYDNLRRLALSLHPTLIVCGASAYPRIIDFKTIHDIAIESGAYMMADIAHIAGLVVSGDHPSPFGLADIITTTTHKTLRGPRGGLIFSNLSLAKKIDSAVFPGMQGGPLQNVIAAKAVAAEEACDPSFIAYGHQIVKNAKAAAKEFIALGYNLVTGGTDNHLLLLDLTQFPITGRELQDYLDTIGITANKNCIPNDPRSPKETSGLRIGTPAMTTKGWREQDFKDCARTIDYAIRSYCNKNKNII